MLGKVFQEISISSFKTDANGDGIVKREEFAAPHPGERKNADAKANAARKKERSTQAKPTVFAALVALIFREAEFDKHVDTNGDGIASIDELFEYINPRNAKSMAAEVSKTM